MGLTVRSLLVTALCFSSAIVDARSAEFSCTGPFGRDSSHAQLVKAFGGSEVVSGDSSSTIVFPKDSARRLQITWSDRKQRRGLTAVTIFPASSWSAGGVAFGMHLVDVERVNGKPFRLEDSGDGGLEAVDWAGGKLAALPGGCSVLTGFKISPSKVTHLEKEGDVEFALSTDPALHAANPALNELTVYFKEADGN
jgi:hypothetical protein